MSCLGVHFALTEDQASRLKNFDSDSARKAFLQEEIEELKAEIEHDDNHERIADEMGDILFACVNLARHIEVNPEQALRDSNLKFVERFRVMEQLLSDDGKVMDDCSVEVLEDYWQKAKSVLASDS